MNLKKMYNAVIIGMICLLIITLILLSSFSSIMNQSRDLNQNGMKLITLSNEMLKINDYLTKLMRVFVIKNNTDMLDEYRSLLTYENLDGKLDEMIKIGLSDSEAEQLDMLYPILENIARLEALAIDKYFSEGSEAAADVIFDDEYVNYDFELTRRTGTLVTEITNRVETGVSDLQKELENMKMIINLFMSLTIIFLLILQIMQRNRVLKPIVEIENMMSEIAKGNVHDRLMKKHDDEIGLLFDHANDMAESIEEYMEESEKSLSIIQNILNGLDAYIYVSDPTNDNILFINEKMKKHFKLTDDCLGERCYKMLQDGYSERCSFCPCYQLDKEPNKKVVWEEHNTVTKRYYRNTDCYIEWHGGQKVHLQHSVDITDMKRLLNSSFD